MEPASVHTVLLQGENADGVRVHEHVFAIAAADDLPTVSATDRVIAAILDSRDDASGAGLELNSIGVAPTNSKRTRYVTRWPPTRWETSCWSRPSWPPPH